MVRQGDGGRRRERDKRRAAAGRSARPSGPGRRGAALTRSAEGGPDGGGAVELSYLPGLREVVEREIRERLGGRVRALPVAGRPDAVQLRYRGSWRDVLALRTVHDVAAVLSFPIPRPGSLLDGRSIRAIADTIGAVRRLAASDPPASFRFDAAGRDSAVFRRLGQAVGAATGLPDRTADGVADIVLRVRRTPGVPAGWDVLVRLSTRPLSVRPWRVRDTPGGLDATLAAALVRLTRPQPGDRVVNLMCGSGTLLAERLLVAPARFAVGVDVDPAMLELARANLAAAGLAGRVTLLAGDVAGPAAAGGARADPPVAGWAEFGPFDVLLADPPWGGLVGSHRTNEALYQGLLRAAAAAAAPGARFGLVSYDARRMNRSLAATPAWQLETSFPVTRKTAHPTVYVLSRC